MIYLSLGVCCLGTKYEYNLFNPRPRLNYKTIFLQKIASSPEDFAVVLPIRFAQPTKHEEDSKLDNNFSVTILNLPIIDGGLRDIQLRCNEIRKSADPIVRWF